MSNLKSTNIANVMTSYNFEIEELPANLKCVKCNFVLKDACQVPCGCTFCRICINDMMVMGGEFCPGASQECGQTLLSTAVPDYKANKSISLIIVKCPHIGCTHECPLVNMKEHLLDCQRKSVECPFRELGCTRDKLTTDLLDEHLQLDNRRHNEILIVKVANINREMEISKREIEILKQRDSENKREIEMMKRELVLKDGQIRTILDQMNHVINENKEVQQANEGLIDRLRVLSEKGDELDSSRLIEYVDNEITAITKLIESNKDELGTQMKSIIDNIESIHEGSQSIMDDIGNMKLQRQSIQDLVRLGEVDASHEWVINGVWKTLWKERESECFYGKLYPYKFQLGQMNCGIISDILWIYLRILPHNVNYVVWPFVGRVTISVADKDKHKIYRSISRECRIDKPENNLYSGSDCFVFRYSELIETGLDLSLGVCVLCEIVPGIAT